MKSYYFFGLLTCLRNEMLGIHPSFNVQRKVTEDVYNLQGRGQGQAFAESRMCVENLSSFSLNKLHIYESNFLLANQSWERRPFQRVICMPESEETGL